MPQSIGQESISFTVLLDIAVLENYTMTHLELLKLLREVTTIIQLICDVLYRVWKNSMPKLLEVIGETDTKIYCQATISDIRPCCATDQQSGSD
jgi:uncharacterized protein (UPF0262 family)